MKHIKLFENFDMNTLADKFGNKFVGGKGEASKNVESIVNILKPLAYDGISSGGNFTHDFFLLEDGTVVSFHYATGMVYLSEKKYTKADFTDESELGYNNPLGDDFEADTQDDKRDLLTYEVDNDVDSYPDEQFSDVQGLANKIINREYKK